jgi:hypothetical protein
MDSQSTLLMLALFAGVGAIVAWAGPRLSRRAISIFLAGLSMAGFGLAAIGTHAGDYGLIVVTAVFAALGILLAIVAKLPDPGR